MSCDVSLWHLPLGKRIGLPPVALTCSPNRSNVLYLWQVVTAEKGGVRLSFSGLREAHG